MIRRWDMIFERLHAELYLMNMDLWLHLISFLDNEAVEVVKFYHQKGQEEVEIM